MKVKIRELIEITHYKITCKNNLRVYPNGGIYGFALRLSHGILKGGFIFHTLLLCDMYQWWNVSILGLWVWALLIRTVHINTNRKTSAHDGYQGVRCNSVTHIFFFPVSTCSFYWCEGNKKNEQRRNLWKVIYFQTMSTTDPTQPALAWPSPLERPPQPQPAENQLISIRKNGIVKRLQIQIPKCFPNVWKNDHKTAPKLHIERSFLFFCSQNETLIFYNCSHHGPQWPLLSIQHKPN